MSPAAKLHHNNIGAHHERQRGIKDNKMINGPRPSPLKINKDFLLHNNPSFSSSSSYSSNNVSNSVVKEKKRSGPVIIYTHSPKVIRTEPSDFMALVQKLTGFSSSSSSVPKSAAPLHPQRNNNDENDSSSVLTEDVNSIGGNGNNNGCGGGGQVVMNSSSSSSSLSSSSCVSVSPMIMNPYCHHLAAAAANDDVPLFTPNYNSSPAVNFYCSPPTFFTYPSGY